MPRTMAPAFAILASDDAGAKARLGGAVELGYFLSRYINTCNNCMFSIYLLIY